MRSRNTSIVRSVLIAGFVFGYYGLIAGRPIPLLVIGILLGAGWGWLTNKLILEKAGTPASYRRRLILLMLGEFVVLLYLVFPALGAFNQTHPVRQPVHAAAQEYEPRAVDLEVTAEDGASIQGWYVPPQNGAVVIALHGMGGNRISVIMPAQALLDQGYGLVLLDLRAHGNSGGATYTPCLAAGDIQAVVDSILAQEPEARIGLLGYSAGGHTALCAAAQIPEVEAVFVDGVAWGQTSDALHPVLPAIKPFLVTTPMNWMFFRFSNLFSGFYEERPVRELVTQIAPRPLYFVAAGGDRYEPELAERYVADAGPGASFWVVDGVGHCGAYDADPEEYSRRLLAFFDGALRDAP